MAASYRISAYDARPPLSERLAASGLSLAIIGGIVLALLWATAIQFVDMGDRGDALSTFDVSSPTPQKSQTRSAPRPTEQQPEREVVPPPPAERAPPPPPVPVPVPRDPGMIVMSRDDFAASDIGRVKSKAAPAAEGQASASAGGGRPVYGPTDTPGGRTIYAADWYREPTRAEMAPFMPASATEGWGMIACQTTDRYRVENCRELGETPGSGIARGLRRAAWQFMVVPPSIDGKPQMGAWVRIRFDLTRGIVD
ncbi:hypothetical protein ASE86_10600 [Sphingomonas sp. Leaf33]|uniref:hypothetical protein n=1 Tax=Sphingomonas sp. Leaf33 TaxID=1736215 RepID=UPI0006F8AE90|nr:hypothetical protein [Sphingomonas sp. Leaf33]KQN26536.1 hypothetical protein ASE86_10600 [Sphingomonas sp. Leaf33]